MRPRVSSPTGTYGPRALKLTRVVGLSIFRNFRGRLASTNSSWDHRGCRLGRRDIGVVTQSYLSRTDPFGPLTSLVLRDLFAESEGHSEPPAVGLEGIAARTALHLSTVHRIASRLTGRGYTRRRQRSLTLTERRRALDDWTPSWDFTAQVAASFHVGLTWPALVPMLDALWREIDWTWTGVAGAALLGITECTPLHRICYVAARDFETACARIEGQGDSMRVDDGGTFHVVVPSELRAQWYRMSDSRWGTSPVVSRVQLALDIAAGPDALAPRTAAPTLEALRLALSGVSESTSSDSPRRSPDVTVALASA
jgi:hypothetical protein